MAHQVADHYAVLGLEVGAGPTDIKKAYHKLALEVHPDREGADEERFKEVKEAYEQLMNSKRRSSLNVYGSDVMSSEEEEERAKEFDKRRRKSWGSATKRTPSMGPRRSPSMSSPRSSPAASPAPPPRSTWCRTEVIISVLVATLFLLLSSSSVNLKSPTRTAAPSSPASSLKPAIEIQGSCPESKDIIEGVFIQVGTLLGRPWYRKKPKGSMLYYDSSCDGSSKSPSGWFIMDAAKADEFAGPSFGTGCGTTARIPWDGSQLPFGTLEWEVACASSVPTKVNLTITKVDSAWG